MKRLALRTLLAGALTGACGGGEGLPPRYARYGRPIVGGTLDTGDPAVVGLADNGGFVFCSGTVVDATHVVTAGHCVMDQSNALTPPSFVFVCNDANTDTLQAKPACWLPVAAAAAHPKFDMSSTDPRFPYDIAVVTLAAATSVAPKPLAAGLLPASALGSNLRIVGFGVDDGTAQSGGGVKREALSPITAAGASCGAQYNPDGTYDSQLEMAGFPGTCNGDSGGPAFWPAGQSGEALVGVTSTGDSACSKYGVDTQVGAFLCWLQSAGVTTAACSGQDPDPLVWGAGCDAGPAPDAGADAGPAPDAGAGADAGAGRRAPPPGCGCGGPQGALALAPLFAFLLRRRR